MLIAAVLATFISTNAAIDELVKTDKLACSVVVLKGGAPIYERAVGPGNDMDSIYLIASNTKSITAAAVMKLVEQRKVALTDKLGALIPEYQVGRDVTVHQLLSHTSGIPSAYDTPILKSFDDVLRALKDRPLLAVPGKVFEYQNTNYILLGEIIRRRSGLSYAEYIAKNVLPAARLGQVTVDRPLTKGQRPVAPMLPPNDTVQDWMTGDVFTDGNVFMSVRDLAKWARAVISGDVLQPTSRSVYLTPNLGDYAYGWIVFVDKGTRVFTHTGSWLTYRSFVERYPDLDVTMALACNKKMTKEDRGAIEAALRKDVLSR